jgi:hypothetical protein
MEELIELRSSREVIIKILSLEEETCIMVLNLLWKWCSARNAVNAGEKLLANSEIIYAIRQLTEEWKRKNKPSSVTVASRRHCWTPPPQDFLKINVDGAFNHATKLRAWGFVVRDAAGEAVLAGAGKAQTYTML